MKRSIILWLLSATIISACNKNDSPSKDDIPFDNATLIVTTPNNAGISFMNNMKLVYFERRNVSGVDKYFYEGYFDISTAIYNPTTNSWVQEIPIFARKPMGIMVVAQENILPAPETYLLPQRVDGTTAKLINMESLASSDIPGNVYNNAPVIFTSNMMNVDWAQGEKSKSLNFDLKRVVGKLIIKIADPNNLIAKDLLFKINNTYTICNYDKTYSGSTTTAAPNLIKVDKTTKQGVAYLLPSISGGNINITPVDAALTLQITDNIPISANKITELTITYNGDKTMTISVVLKDWINVTIPPPDCFDVTDSEDIGYYVVNVDGIMWMDRDLGAKYNMPRYPKLTTPENLTSNDDWGYLFQFGRKSDGYQKRTSALSSAILTSPYDTNNKCFIFKASAPLSWLSYSVANAAIPLWRAPLHNNNPCPKGFRLPTYVELRTLYSKLSYDSENQIYYVDGKHRGATKRMYMYAKTYRDNCNGNIVLASNDQLNYWAAESVWLNTNDFMARMPIIYQIAGNITRSECSTDGVTVTRGYSVRCVVDDIN